MPGFSLARGGTGTKFVPMKFPITIDRDEDGIWITSCPSIPGCHSQGSSREEAISNIREGIELCLEVRAERGMPGQACRVSECRLIST